MIGTTGGAVLVIITMAVAGILGIGVGAITCAVLGRPWGLKTAGLDAILALVVAVIAAYVFVAIAVSRGYWGSLVLPIWAVAVMGVIVRHLLTRSSR